MFVGIGDVAVFEVFEFGLFFCQVSLDLLLDGCQSYQAVVLCVVFQRVDLVAGLNQLNRLVVSRRLFQVVVSVLLVLHIYACRIFVNLFVPVIGKWFIIFS